MASKYSYGFINADNITSGPYLSTAVKVTASRAYEDTKDVVVAFNIYLGFGSTSNSSSYTQGAINALCWTGSSSYDSAPATTKVSASINPSGTKWARTSSTWARLVVSDGLNQYGYATVKSATVKFTISNWTSGSKTFYFYVTGCDSSKGQSVTVSCPEYYTAPAVYMTSESQTVSPGSSVTLSWRGSNGSNNPISNYTLYYDGTSVYSGTGTSYTVSAPDPNSSKEAYVVAKGKNYSSATSTKITISTSDYGTPSVVLNTMSKSVNVGALVKIEWTGTDGESNPIASYSVYLDGTEMYRGLNTSWETRLSGVEHGYVIYVVAHGQYGNKDATSDSITITARPFMWVSVSGAWKPVRMIYVKSNGVWKDVDYDNPVAARVTNGWRNV